MARMSAASSTRPRYGIRLLRPFAARTRVSLK
jgi:hypothetical protein